MARQNSAAAIERAAVRLFAKYGFVGTSIRDLASEVGVSTANIYNHTASKEEMLWKIISRTMGDLLVNAARAEGVSTCPVAQLEAFVSAHVTYHATHRGEARIGNTQWRHLSDERMQVVHGQRDQYTHALEAIIERGFAQSYFKQPQGKFATLSLIAMGLGVSQWYRSSGSHDTTDIAAIYVGFAFDMLHLDAAFHDENCPDPGHTQIAASTASSAV
ncbi:TetR/AcrR family transcriptional regulator [Nocardioides hwasunensis]|uniref:TetR family transcriptional regulator n=1 Tax=Nocardioides hwasunensis TaxID=397258 RepID=A0ABR8MHM1_9ACTN|nr:TetR family transcriptional regulator [Nocardioides hwasunensis]MBD3915055.1 TetR family transcriptional regulator [Nocardioides hwasunensis]